MYVCISRAKIVSLTCDLYQLTLREWSGISHITISFLPPECGRCLLRLYFYKAPLVLFAEVNLARRYIDGSGWDVSSVKV